MNIICKCGHKTALSAGTRFCDGCGKPLFNIKPTDFNTIMKERKE